MHFELVTEIIETYWNVNDEDIRNKEADIELEIIETYWNVN